MSHYTKLAVEPEQTERNWPRGGFCRAVIPLLIALFFILAAPKSASAAPDLWCRDGNTPTLGPCGAELERICVVDAWWNASNCPSECQPGLSLRWGVCRAACPGREELGICCGDLGEV